MVDEETGIDPVARDGEPGDDADQELAERRRRRRQRERAEEVATGLSDDGRRGQPIDEQPDDDDPAESELFPMGSIPGDHGVTMKNIVGAARSRKTEAKMRATPIALRDGLVRYGELVELLVTVEAGKVEEVPDLEEPESGGRRKLLGVKDVQHFRPVHVTAASGMFTRDQVLDILEQEFGIPRSADKVAEVFGPVTAAQRAAAVAAG